MPRAHRRLGVTLLELLLVLGIVGLVAASAWPALRPLHARWAVRQARDDLHLLLAAARWRAVAHQTTVTIRFATDGSVRAESAAWHITRSLAEAYGVTLRANRSAIAYGADGLGVGAANVSIELRRGDARDSVVVSRLGRAR
ncbi:MAG: prepilin-type N-terminal cleavage/methylation domain-containing protein [Gemmatimonadaceae bacterium]|nr:prepilin-type N-terminal cleavage/methylation domain-containing protein [Gemmatimonadaceae bacterium]